jgi:hypothetical protein
VTVIPWPVIESLQFYKLFEALKKRLEARPPTYENAGSFLHTMKMLMAKLKVRVEGYQTIQWIV